MGSGIFTRCAFMARNRYAPLHPSSIPHWVPIGTYNAPKTHSQEVPFLVWRSAQHRRDQVNLSEQLRSKRQKFLDVDHLEGHRGCGRPRVKAVSEQRVLLVCKGQWDAPPFKRAKPEGWSWSDHWCVH